MKNVNKLPSEYYLKLIANNEPFQLARFGDGEILCMQLAPLPIKQNCDGSEFIPELIEPMRQIFRNNYNYYHCALDCTLSIHGEEFRKFLDETCPEMEFYDGEIWQHLSFSGRIREFIDTIAPYSPCFIGGEHIENVKYMNGFEGGIRYITAPSINSYYEFDRLYDECIKMHTAGCRMFLFSCGYTTKILIDKLYTTISDSFLIDLGSLMDPYCGKLSRSGMRFCGFEKFQPYTNFKLTL